MINVSDEVKTLFLKDSTKKKLTIKVQNPDNLDLNELNYYTGNSGWSDNKTISMNAGEFELIRDLENLVDLRGFERLNYARASIDLKFTNITSSVNEITTRCTFERQDGTSDYQERTVLVSDYTDEYKRLYFQYDASNDNPIVQIRRLELFDGNYATFAADLSVKALQVEMANDVDDLLTTYSNHFSKDYDLSAFSTSATIKNEDLEFENFTLTESLCSQDNLKFGLCESAHCEFTIVGDFGNLNGRQIKPGISVQGTPSVEDIEKINFWKDKSGIMTKGSTYTQDGHTGSGGRLWTNNYLIYTDLPGEYFSRTEYIYVSYKAQLSNISVLSGTTPTYYRYGVICVYEDDTLGYWVEDTYRNFVETGFSKPNIPVSYIYNDKKYKEVQRVFVNFYDSNKTRLTSTDIDITYSIKEIQVQPTNDYNADYSYDPSMTLIYDNTLDEYCEECYSDPIPLGVFHITDVRLEHTQNLVKQQIEAYDNIVKLEQNAYNWYTTYMFGLSTSDKATRYDVQYARQIFSSYFNLMQQLGLESRSNYTETLLGTYDYWDDIKPSHMANKWLIWDSTANVGRMRYSEFTINNVDTTKMYMVDAVNVDNCTDQETEDIVPSDYATKFDGLRRGIATNGGVLVEFYTSSDVLIDGIVVNRRDYFMVYPNTSYIKVYIPTYDAESDGTPFQRFIDSVSLYEVSSAPHLVNGYYRLFYYQYTSDANDAAVLFDANSSMTGRDVIHSLLEVCGCFFRLNRETGKPEFVYCTKGGLYPRNNLYPDDDLYPRAGTDSILPNGRYMSVIQNNYSVQDYGRIQIVRDTDSNESKSICEWEYKGSNSLNTYLIDDNVFYCNKDLQYEYDAMPYISGLLQNMWINISNMGYVPNVTQALGMPWIECGDRIGILTYTGGFESFIFRRTIKGIQLLIDTIESEGDEYNEAIKDFGYELYNS